MKTKWFEISGFSGEMREVSVTRETAQFIYRENGSRDAKTQTWRGFRKTEKECLEWLVQKRLAELNDARNRHEQATAAVGEAERELVDARARLEGVAQC